MHLRSLLEARLGLTALLIACNGRVAVGTELSGSGGAGAGNAVAGGGTSAATSGGSNIGGGRENQGGESSGGITAMTGGNAGSAVGGASGITEAGASGEGGASGPRWLALTTQFTARSEVNFLNLAARSSKLLTVEEESGSQCPFSPDGHFGCFVKSLDSGLAEVFLVDTSSSELGAPRSLGRFRPGGPCSWSPDSKKLVCLQEANDISEVVLFEPANPATLAPVSLGPSQSRVTWASDGALFFTDGTGELVRVEWLSDGSAHAVPTGLAGELSALSPDREIAVFVPANSFADDQEELLNLVTLDHAPLGLRSGWRISPSFRSVVLVEGSATSEVPATLSYFWLDGINLRLVDTRQFALWPDDVLFMQFAGERFVELHEGRLVLTSIAPEAVEAEEVAGGQRDMTSLAASADGRWITFAAYDEAVGTMRPMSRWLIRLDDSGIRSLSKLDEFRTATRAAFSPDSSKLLVFYHDPYREDAKDPEPGALFSLREPGAAVARYLDLPRELVSGTWSTDSSFFAFIDGGDGANKGALYAVDALDAAQAPRLVASCDSNGPPGAGCPGAFLFQP